MLSSNTTVWPTRTVSPALTDTATAVPCIGDSTFSWSPISPVCHAARRVNVTHYGDHITATDPLFSITTCGAAALSILAAQVGALG